MINDTWVGQQRKPSAWVCTPLYYLALLAYTCHRRLANTGKIWMALKRRGTLEI